MKNDKLTYEDYTQQYACILLYLERAHTLARMREKREEK